MNELPESEDNAWLKIAIGQLVARLEAEGKNHQAHLAKKILTARDGICLYWGTADAPLIDDLKRLIRGGHHRALLEIEWPEAEGHQFVALDFYFPIGWESRERELEMLRAKYERLDLCPITPLARK